MFFFQSHKAEPSAVGFDFRTSAGLAVANLLQHVGPLEEFRSEATWHPLFPRNLQQDLLNGPLNLSI